MRSSALVVGILLLLLGAVWMGQGLGYVRGSFMTGVVLWAWAGGLCMVAGGVMAGLALRRGRTPR